MVREGCLEGATTEVRTDEWRRLAGKGMKRPEKASPINSEHPEWREGKRGQDERHRRWWGGGWVPGDSGRNGVNRFTRHQEASQICVLEKSLELQCRD